MASIVQAAAIYLFLLLIFRIAGRRTMSEMTHFDFVLLLIISEATQGAMVGNDHSFTNAALLIVTLVGMDVILSHVKQRSKSIEKWMEGVPIVIVRDGRADQELLQKTRVDIEDILAAARMSQGIGSMDGIAFAVLETSGAISVIPKPRPASSHP
jgi:uncharacterized membrane protein YcaP (DUF421 family)